MGRGGWCHCIWVDHGIQLLTTWVRLAVNHVLAVNYVLVVNCSWVWLRGHVVDCGRNWLRGCMVNCSWNWVGSDDVRVIMLGCSI
jgi:hypothetical protein